MKLSNLNSALIIVAVVVLPSSSEYRAHAFVPICQPPRTSASMVPSTFGGKGRTLSSVLWYADSPPDTLSEMKSSEMKKELESYGISTKSMFDKKEFETALEEARLSAPEIFEKETTNEKDKQTTTSSDAEKDKRKKTTWGKPENNGDKKKKKNKRENWSSKLKDMASVAKEAFDSRVNPSSTGKSSSNRKKSASTRPERYELALEEGRAMKLSGLKKELHDRGISTSSFFEKSDLVKAYANAIADHVKVKSANTSSSRNDEVFDPSYRTVIMHAFDPSTILAASDVIIDVA